MHLDINIIAQGVMILALFGIVRATWRATMAIEKLGTLFMEHEKACNEFKQEIREALPRRRARR